MKTFTVLLFAMSLSLCASAGARTLNATEALRAVLDPGILLSVESDVQDIFPEGSTLSSTKIDKIPGENVYQIHLLYTPQKIGGAMSSCSVTAIVDSMTGAVSFVNGTNCH